MSYIDWNRLDGVDANAFRGAAPYPWINPQGLLTPEGFDKLRTTLPDVSKFERLFGVKRSHGQQSHDRFALEWKPGLELPKPWDDFIAELRTPRYMAFLHRLYGNRPLLTFFHWHYTPRGCSVSPHCDARRKLGSHIFLLQHRRRLGSCVGRGDADPRRRRTLQHQERARVRGLRALADGALDRQLQPAVRAQGALLARGQGDPVPRGRPAQGLHRHDQ
jgi:hypothetical protein